MVKSEVDVDWFSLIVCGMRSAHNLIPNPNTGRSESGTGLKAVRMASCAKIDIEYSGKEYEILAPFHLESDLSWSITCWLENCAKGIFRAPSNNEVGLSVRGVSRKSRNRWKRAGYAFSIIGFFITLTSNMMGVKEGIVGNPDQ